MTCIVAITDGIRVLIGGDSASIGGGEIRVQATRKVFPIGAYAIGYTTSWRMGQILQHETQLPEPAEAHAGDDLEAFIVSQLVPIMRQSFKAHGFSKTVRTTADATHTEDGQEVSGIFLLGVSGHIFEVRQDYQVVRPLTPYTAVGQGALPALGAFHALITEDRLDLRDKAEIALQAAQKHTNSVRAPFHFVEL